MNRSQLLGGWSMAGMELDVVEIGHGLAVSFPSAPEGFESGLEGVGEDEYVIRGGQFDGARILPSKPFTTGMLYLLPRDTFERLPLHPGPMSNEWVSHEPVRPIARLTIEPDDFPFLEQIGGHDDGALIRFGELGDEIDGRLLSAERIDSGFEIVTTADRSQVDRFIEMGSAFYPDVTRVTRDTLDGVAISMTGPPAFLDAMGKKLAPHLSDAH